MVSIEPACAPISTSGTGNERKVETSELSAACKGKRQLLERRRGGIELGLLYLHGNTADGSQLLVDIGVQECSLDDELKVGRFLQPLRAQRLSRDSFGSPCSRVDELASACEAQVEATTRQQPSTHCTWRRSAGP